MKEKSSLAGDNAQLKLQVLRFKELLAVRGEERQQAEGAWRLRVDQLEAGRQMLLDQLAALEQEQQSDKQPADRGTGRPV